MATRRKRSQGFEKGRLRGGMREKARGGRLGKGRGKGRKGKC